MILAKVRGTVVATRKDQKLEGRKLLVVSPLDAESGKQSGYVIAVDTVGAGVGETVICVSGSSARMATGMKDHPIDTAIIGIVDTVKLEE
ncbi:MAG: EutN/CcmL family microcompartment protein [Acidobacteriota bacterium]